MCVYCCVLWSLFVYVVVVPQHQLSTFTAYIIVYNTNTYTYTTHRQQQPVVIPVWWGLYTHPYPWQTALDYP